jgi:hypothetical protein
MLGDFNEADKQQFQIMLEALLRRSEALCALEAKDEPTEGTPPRQRKTDDT